MSIMNRHHHPFKQDATGSRSSPRKKRNRRQRQQQQQSGTAARTIRSTSAHRPKTTKQPRPATSMAWMDDDIEEQLRVQRLTRQQEQQLQQEQMEPDDDKNEQDYIQTKSASRPQRLGSFVYDPERDAYFPESFLIAQKHQEQQQQSDLCAEQEQSFIGQRPVARFMGGRRCFSAYSSSTSSVWLSYVREFCASRSGGERYRQNLTCQWRGRHWLEQLQIWPDVRLPTCNHANDQAGAASSWPCPNDTPWNRTFDVATMFSPTSSAISTTYHPLPPIMYRIEGTHLRAGNAYGGSDAAATGGAGSTLESSIAATHVKVLEGHSPNRSVVVALNQSEECCTVRVMNVDAVHRAGYTVQLPPCRIHDCTRSTWRSGSTALWFAGVASATTRTGRPRCHNHQLLWTDDDLDGGYGVFYCGHGLPSSDILAMENLDVASSVVLGHRNGQVSLQDLRARNATSCSILESAASSSLDGSSGNSSVVALHPLNEHRPYEILVRRNNSLAAWHDEGGMCQLLDARQFASAAAGSSTTTTTSSRSSVVHELRLPHQRRQRQQQQHCSSSSSSTCCKGVATDPYQTIAMAPYVDATSQTARLAVWSLDTGVMVASRPLMDAATTNLQCLELCSKITSTWKTDHMTTTQPVMVPGSYSLWLNGGPHGIRQLVCPGRGVG